MFSTRDDYCVPVPKPIARDGERYWRFCELNIGLPWYLVTLELTREDSEGLMHSVLVCWGSDLLDFVRPNSVARAIAIQRLTRARRHEDGWRAQKVTAVYDGGEEAPTKALLEVEGEAGLLSDDFADVSPSTARLVARLPMS